nr:MAG TPA: terminase [Caudoviricetes sp.]
MIHTNLVQALEKQIEFCNQYTRYKCGVFVRTKAQREIVMKCISNLLLDLSNIQLRNYEWKLGCYWNNGNCIEVLPVNDSVRGHRFNGVIIENEIERDIVNSLIMPYLMVRIDSSGHKIEEFNNVKERIFTVDISKNDVIESKNRSIYISTGWRRGLRNSNIFIDDLCEESFKKEYTCMFNNHTAAFRVAQVGTDKIYIYNAIGIPKENIKYETEFVNRTKETYLNIKGEHKVEGIGFENEIDVHLLIDTNVYDKYEVDFHDGLVFVFLHEIINKKPVLEDVSKMVKRE